MDNQKVSVVTSLSENINGSEGFIGRWQFAKYEIKDFGRDLWCEGTKYYVMKFQSSSDKFLNKCMEKVLITCDVNFVKKIKKVEVKSYYVPIYNTGKCFVCLHNQMPDLSYNFFKNGICDCVPPIPLEVFDIKDFSNRSSIQFLSIGLSIADVNYFAHSSGYNFKEKMDPEVYFLPVHYLTFECDGKKYFMMSWGDEDMNNFMNTPLPHDEVLHGRKLIYSLPLISMTVISTVMIVVLYFCYTYAMRVWHLLDWDALYKLIVLSIPILLVYLVTWGILLIVAATGKTILLSLEKLLSRKVQKDRIEKDFNKKKEILKRIFPSLQLKNPNSELFRPDLSLLDNTYDSFIGRLHFGG